MIEQYVFKTKSLNSLRDTPEKLGYKEHDQFLAIDVDGVFRVMSVFTGLNNEGKPVLKFPNTLHKIVSNVTLT